MTKSKKDTPTPSPAHTRYGSHVMRQLVAKHINGRSNAITDTITDKSHGRDSPVPPARA